MEFKKLALLLGWNYEEMIEKSSERSISTLDDVVEVPLTKIFVGGSAFDMGDCENEEHMQYAVEKAYELGHALSLYENVAVITGACPKNSLPHIAVETMKANKENAVTVGILGEPSLDDIPHYDDIRGAYTAILSYDFSVMPNFRPVYGNLLYRDVINGCSCDGMISLMGGMGTLGEISITSHEGKPVGFVSGTGGTSDIGELVFNEIKSMGQKIGAFFAHPDPYAVVEWTLQNTYRVQK